MATLVFTALGTVLGGPLGGAIGALAGRQVDALVFSPRPREGPRLAELAVSSSSYGHTVPRVHGRCRVPGQVIWATDLIEQRSRHGNGKGRPATISYSYSASFAVALSSRPIEGIGRIWADGKLLRGAAGDLKTGGVLRIHLGHGDQAPDPLIAAAEGANGCPAYRGLAYVVFEDLQLGDFGNRIPTLSFEVFGSAYPLRLDSLIDPAVSDCDADVLLDGLDGMAIDGAAADLLAMLAPLFPLDCDACDERLTLRPARRQNVPLALPEAAVAADAGEFGGKAGFARSRSTGESPPVGVLRHYDPDRDYQPGTQRAVLRRIDSQPLQLELPATIAAAAARRLVDNAARRHAWGQQTVSWRISQVDPAIRPGSMVTLPGQAGHWLVKGWEWRADGVELALIRAAPQAPPTSSASDPGRVGNDPDWPAAATVVQAFELPWDGKPATPVPQLFAAAGSTGPGWAGAALYVDQGDGALQPLGPTGRLPAVLGTAQTALDYASPLLVDRHGTVEIALHDPSQTLPNATAWQLAQGANKALLGQEIIQFATADPLGDGRWRLSGLWRGRGGTEHAVAGHLSGEPFVLLENPGAALDSAMIASPETAEVMAIGLGDNAPVGGAIALAGIGGRPLAPVHGWLRAAPDGTLMLGWTRRARGGWRWPDGVDLPLGEQREAYLVELNADGAVAARWETAQPQLTINAANLASFAMPASARWFAVRQSGDRALSLPLIIPAP